MNEAFVHMLNIRLTLSVLHKRIYAIANNRDSWEKERLKLDFAVAANVVDILVEI